MQQLIIDLALPAERYLAWYQGRAERVVMYSFLLSFTDEGKLLNLERLSV